MERRSIRDEAGRGEQLPARLAPRVRRALIPLLLPLWLLTPAPASGAEPKADACAAPEEAVGLALPLIKRHEGLARCVDKSCAILAAYPDPGVGAALPTIGYGHTSLAASGRSFRVRLGQTITRHEAEAILRTDAWDVAEGVCRLTGTPVSAPQLAALISFSYNLGLGRLARSGLLRALNRGDHAAAARAFSLYVNAGRPPRPLKGLVRRRLDERRLFESGAFPAPAPRRTP